MVIKDKGHAEACPYHYSSLQQFGSCHCDQDTAFEVMSAGLAYAGWQCNNELEGYFWRKLSCTEAIELNRHKDGWEFRWIKGDCIFLCSKGYATPRDAIAALYEDMHAIIKKAGVYRSRIHALRKAMDDLKL